MPTKRLDADNSKNLDLNTTAKKHERGKDQLNPYLANNTYCVLRANLAFPIASFEQEQELELQRKLDEQKLEERLQVEEYQQAVQRGEIQEIKSVMGESFERTNHIVYPKRVVKDKIDPNDAIYERLVIVIPYKAPDQVRKIS